MVRERSGVQEAPSEALTSALGAYPKNLGHASQANPPPSIRFQLGRGPQPLILEGTGTSATTSVIQDVDFR